MDPKPTKNLSPVNNDSPEKRAIEIRRRSYDGIRNYIKSFYGGNISEFIEKIKKNIISFIPKIENIDSLFADCSVKYTKDENLDELIDQATEITIKTLTQHLSLSELEKLLRMRHFEYHPTYIELSRGLSYEVYKENNLIYLHIPTTFFEDSKAALDSLITGLKNLAHKLKTDIDLKDVKDIIGVSPIVLEKYRTLIKAGFTILLDEDTGKPISDEAIISREKLLEIYGK